MAQGCAVCRAARLMIATAFAAGFGLLALSAETSGFSSPWWVAAGLGVSMIMAVGVAIGYARFDRKTDKRGASDASAKG